VSHFGTSGSEGLLIGNWLRDIVGKLRVPGAPMSKFRSYSVNAKVAIAALVALVAAPLPALAGAVAPAPLAGVLGPYGLVAAGLAYGGYRVVKHLRSRR
jgi:hypothetical protein